MIPYKWVTVEQDSLQYTAPSGQVWFFSIDPSNRYYQEYLAWLAEGNEPLPADEPPAAE